MYDSEEILREKKNLLTCFDLRNINYISTTSFFSRYIQLIEKFKIGNISYFMSLKNNCPADQNQKKGYIDYDFRKNFYSRDPCTTKYITQPFLFIF